MNRKIFYILALLFAFGGAMAQKVRFYDVKTFDNYQQVLQAAINQNKMLFLVVYEDGDEFYKMQREDIFADNGLAAAYDTTIPLAVDVTSDMGARLAESFGVEATPTFYFLTPGEVLVLVKEGYLTIGQLKEALNEAEKNAADYEVLKEKYSSHTLTNAEWKQLLEIYALNFSFTDTQILALEFLNTLSTAELTSPQVLPILTTYGIDLETKYPQIIIENRQKLKDTNTYKAFYQSAYGYNFDRAEANNDTVLLAKITEILIPNSPDDKADKSELAFETKKVFAVDTRNFGVWKRATLELVKSKEDDSTKAEVVFDEAFEIADNFNSKEAQRAARQLAHEANVFNPDFRYKMLEAYMAYLLEDYSEADALVKQASALTDNPNNNRKAEGLQKMISREMNNDQKTEPEGSKESH